MSDLDKKLHDLLYEQADSYYFEGSSPEWFEEKCPELIEKFKQAFTDAGYRDLSSRGGLVSATVVDQCGRVDYMTGQEWNKRFHEEVERFNYDHRGGIDIYLSNDLIEVAKKASGIE